MSIWDNADTDWTSGDGLRAAQLFERAYPNRTSAREIAYEVGIPWPTSASSLGHSELWVALLETAARAGRVLDLAAELLSDPQRRVFTTPLHQILGDQLGVANAVRVTRHGLPPRSTDQAHAIIASLDVASTAEALLPSDSDGQLQSLNSPGAGLMTVDAHLRMLLDARRRVALVRRGLSAVGTGFLVGPDLLLTAAHVISPNGDPQPGDVDAVDVVMDFYDHRTSISETGTPVPVKELLRASSATDQELNGPLVSWDAPEDKLDYALLRLGRRVGEDPTDDRINRGWYQLETAEPALDPSRRVLVLHFPVGSYLNGSTVLGEFEFHPSGTRTRMRYRTNTLPGSSGGPLIDELGRLLGVHHYGTPNQNQAVPIWLIARAVEDLVSAVDLDAPPSPHVGRPAPATEGATRRVHEVLQVGPRPLVNRLPLRSKLWAAMADDNAANCLVIVGATESGISWSWWLLSHLASKASLLEELQVRAPEGVQAVRVDLRKDITRPAAERRAALIRAVSKRLANEITDEWVIQVAREVSDFKDWCYQQLVGNGRQWWIFVDSIDETGDVDQHGIGEVLSALVDLADDPQLNLRLVLAGQRADKLSHSSLQWAATDSPVGLTREDVKTWLEEMAKSSGRRPDIALVEAFLDRWFIDSQARRPVELTLALPAAVAEVST
jgi:hypothetical protein